MGSRLTPSPVDTAARLGLDVNGIMWTDATVNPGLFGCAKVSPACTNCYAEITAAGIVRKGRSPKSAPGMRATADFYAEGLTADGRWTGRVSVRPERIGPAFAGLPKKAGRVRRVFFSMIDLFHADVPFEFIAIVYGAMAARPWINFQVLTKRADRMVEFYRWLGRDGRDECETIINAADAHDGDGHEPALLGGGLYIGRWPIPNIWAGVTVERQKEADERIPHLLQVPAAVRFLSVEPLLGEIDLDYWIDGIIKVAGDDKDGWTCTSSEAHDPLGGTWDTAEDARTALGPDLQWWEEEPDVWMAEVPRIDWVIVGSESDGPRPGARETREEWITDIVDQCDVASVPVFVKQAAIAGKLCTLPLVDGKVRAGFPEVTRA